MKHAKVAHLVKHNISGCPFSRIMAEIEANQEEGLDDFELDVIKLDDQECIDLIEALEAMGYIVTYEKDEATFIVQADI